MSSQGWLAMRQKLTVVNQTRNISPLVYRFTVLVQAVEIKSSFEIAAWDGTLYSSFFTPISNILKLLKISLFFKSTLLGFFQSNSPYPCKVQQHHFLENLVIEHVPWTLLECYLCLHFDRDFFLIVVAF